MVGQTTTTLELMLRTFASHCNKVRCFEVNIVTGHFSITFAVHIEDCESWWLSSHCNSVAMHWLHEPGIWVLILTNDGVCVSTHMLRGSGGMLLPKKLGGLRLLLRSYLYPNTTSMTRVHGGSNTTICHNIHVSRHEAFQSP